MAIFKCKMCGGDLEVAEGMKVCECEYCGTKQTIPNSDDEKKINLFNRANRLRFANEFDKASGIFESIIAEFPEEAEAYWGLCLCKYGIEYVDDPATAKKIPTCHRTSYDNIFDDNNFEMALEYADTESIRIYRAEAEEIDRLQKSILEIAQKEEPFDIFICYKETDEKGQRTKDSVLAQDMYDALTEKGYKVFFSRITLEDKLGQEFEPYIFSALNSAKVMLAVGTKYEYFHAVWVKNEWSRFLDLMQGDKSKVLIPCYCDIDAYDMPTEFKNLQGQDMSKIGFMQDLIRGVGKIIHSDDAVSVKETVVTNGGNVDTEPLLKRISIFLEDGDWVSADKYCEKVLDIDPENAQAYLYKLMSKLHAGDEASLLKMRLKFNDYDDYRKAVRFADEKIKIKIQSFEKQMTENFNEDKYNQAVEKMSKIRSCDSINVIVTCYMGAIEILESMGDYKDSQTKIEECKKNLYEKGIARKNHNPYDAIYLLKLIRDYKDVNQQIVECEELPLFNTAKSIIKKYHPKTEDIKRATSKFKSLKCCSDAEKYIEICQRMITILEAVEPIEKKKEQLGLFQLKEKKQLQGQIDKLYELLWKIQLEI